jgi:hypothetical protein
MPLAYNVAVAIHRSEDRPTVLLADKRMVATVNSITVAFSQRFICSSTENFICVLPGGNLGNAEETMAVLVKLKESE